MSKFQITSFSVMYLIYIAVSTIMSQAIENDFVGKIIRTRAFFFVSVEKGSFFNNCEVG